MSASGTARQPRVGSRQQAELLALLRDEGAISRVALGERVGLPRAKLTAELGKLVDTGLVEVGGPAASRGGRRSTF
ncbi:MAG TPA: winged helix-turn-helix transcriptional regulator, partial [Umezawaea sp.]|nr:winged helix-turn-helix transcriptional regulator [Umezawaea sp.]